MIAWPAPDVPALPGTGPAPRVHDDATGALVELRPRGPARVYVCGITPYDATHLGHAATYVTFDVLLRVLADAGHEVVYAQNVTDIDDPLLERAARDERAWEELAAAEVQLFRDDMAALRVRPPEHFVGVVEAIPQIGAAVADLVAQGSAYAVPVPAGEGEGEDLYLDLSLQPTFGATSGWTRAEMLDVVADRGGDPDRPGKKDPLDPLLWRAAREGEPAWRVAGLPPGRPGWHIECTVIACEHLGVGFDVQGGGTDLVFPHHEMSAVQADALHGPNAFARTYLHQAMVGLHGEKMSKSKGNLVLVSRLRAAGVDPAAIRLALLAHHYRSPWDWTDATLERAQARLAAWRHAAAIGGDEAAETLLANVRAALADDLDTPAALARLDAWAQEASSAPATSKGAGGSPLLTATVDALLGVAL